MAAMSRLIAKPNALSRPLMGQLSYLRPARASFTTQALAQQDPRQPDASQVQQQSHKGGQVEKRKPSGRSAIAPRRSSMVPVLASDLLFPPGLNRMSTFMQDMQDELDAIVRAFGGSDIGTSGSTGKSLSPVVPFAVDVREEDKQYVFHADVPGLSKEDIKIKLTPDNVLVISGERKLEREEKESDNFQRMERVYGKFERRFQLPDHINKEGISAKVEHGVLMLIVPKTEESQQNVRDIPVE